MRILLLVDDHFTVETIREHIPSEQYDLSHATRLEVGLQRSKEASPDIVIVSIPVADGRPALAAVRAAYPTAVIIALVPSEDQALGERALADGADDYLTTNQIEMLLPHALRYAAAQIKTYRTLEKSKARYRSLFSNNHSVMLLLDPESGKIIDSNPAACRFYGYSRETLQQMSIFEINQLPPDEIRAEMQRAYTEEHCHFYFQHRLASGEIRDVEVYSGPIDINGDALLYSLVHDITERRRAEAALQWAFAVNAAAAELARALISPASLEDIAMLVLDQARELTSSAFGYVGHIDPQTGYLVSSTLTHDIWDSCQVEDKDYVFKKFGGLWGWVLKNRQSTLVNDLFNDPRSTGIPEGHVPIERFLAAPALIKGKLLGQIALANPDRPYEQKDLEAVERLASLYAVAVQRHWADKERQQYAEEQTTLYNISAALASLQEPQVLLAEILDVMLTVLNGDAGWVTALESNSAAPDETRLITHQGIDPELIPDIQCTIVEVCPLYNSPPISCTPAHLIPNCDDLQPELGTAFRQQLCIPLYAGGKVLGILSILWHSDFEIADFSDDFFTAVGQQMGVTLQNAQLYEAALQVDRLQALNALDAALAATLEPEKVAEISLRHLMEAVDATQATLLLHQDHAMGCVHYTLSSLADEVATRQPPENLEALQALVRTLPPQSGPTLIAELRERRADVNDETFADGWEDATLLAPIWNEEEPIGILLFGPRQDARPFSSEDRALIQAGASGVGQALQNAHLYQASRAKSIRLVTLNSISAVAVSSLNPNLVMREIIERMCETLDAVEGSILLLDEETGQLHFAITLDERAHPLKDMVLAPGQGIAGWVAQECQAVRVNDVRSDPRFYDGVDRAAGFSTTSLLCAPLIHREDVIGVIEIVNKRKGAFSAHDLHLLESAASIAAAALENARLYNDAQRRAGELAQVNEVGLTLTSSLDTAKISQMALEEVSRLFENDGTALLQTDDDDEHLHVVHAFYNGEHRRPPFTLPVDEGISGWVLTNRQAVRIKDAQTDPRFWEGAPTAQLEPHAMLVAPLLAQTHVIGVVLVMSRKINAYTEEDLHLLQALAPMLSATLENARLYEDLKHLLREREQAQARLIQTEKMAAIGRLVASLAHEINNPLQAIQGCLTLAHEEIEEVKIDPSSLAYYVNVAEEEIDRISGILRRMRDFYRPARQEYRLTHVHDVLESVLALTRKQLEHNDITVEHRWSEELPQIYANPDRLKQVFLNFVLNAMDAMPEGGALTIITAETSRHPDGEAIKIVFADTGMGMDKATQARIFEPFFTTKPDGSGLGLSISYGIIQAHRGDVDITSEVGRGTTMTIRLPVGSKEKKHSLGGK